MILYNVTVKVDFEILEDWLSWMQTVHIPDVMKTGIFSSYKMSKILGQDESDGPTYAIQYLCPSMTEFNRYQAEFAQALQKEHTSRYKDKYVAFRTLMEVVAASK